ncbi:MAG: flippase-like domain-containing protein [Actinomycetia bacterium]|nr:flippase-like domain-containing protein [Actinomycetes bacterium]
MNLESQNKKSNKRRLILRIINIVVVVGFGAFLVYYLLSHIDIEDIKNAFINIYKPSLITALLLFLLSDYFRAYRSNILIGSDRIGMGDMFLVAQIRNAFNMVLPARTGELSYIYVLTRRFGFPLEIGVSTLIVVLIFDLIIVFSLIIISIIIVGINTYAVSSVSMIIIASVFFIIFLLVLFYLSKIIRFLLFVFEKILRKLRISEKKVIYRIYNKIIDINENIKTIQKRRIYWKVYLSSIVIRVLKFTAYYLIIYAVMKPMGYSFTDLSYWVILLATVAAEISAALPTHALAGFGTYEGAFALAFVLLGFSKEIAIVVGFSYHIIVLLFTVILGIISMIIISLPFYRIKK